MATAETTNLVSLKGLNQVYADLRRRISKLGTIYHVKGTKTWSELIALASATQGDVYNIKVPEDGSDPSPSPDIKDGSNVVCIQTFSSAISPADWANYWDVLEGLFEVATDDTAGVIKTGTSINTPNSANLTTVERGVRLSANDNAYITIPAASTSSYGVITTGAQTFSGAKTYNGDAAFNGNITISNAATVSYPGTLQVSRLRVNDVTITSTAGVISFEL